MNDTTDNAELIAAQHPGCTIIEDPDTNAVFAFGRLTRDQLSRYMGGVLDGHGDRSKPNHRMLLDVLRYPGREEFERRLEEEPGLILSLADEVMRVSGAKKSFKTVAPKTSGNAASI